MTEQDGGWDDLDDVLAPDPAPVVERVDWNAVAAALDAVIQPELDTLVEEVVGPVERDDDGDLEEEVAEGQVTLFGSDDEFRPAWQEWKGMPEFNQQDLAPYRTLNVHFASRADEETFATLIGQRLPPITSAKGVWFPKPDVAHFVDKRYRSVEEEGNND